MPPTTQDASASAYQIMSYLLLDHEIATHTNLIPTDHGNIVDIYNFILYFTERIDDDMGCSNLYGPSK